MSRFLEIAIADWWSILTKRRRFLCVMSPIFGSIILKSPNIWGTQETPNHLMATYSSPSKADNKLDVAEEEEEEEVDPLLPFHHVRTASVILRSGDRVRRKVSLMSIYDESPLEQVNNTTALLDPRGTAGTSYSSITPSLVDREIQPWEITPYDKFKIWLHSEGLKR